VQGRIKSLYSIFRKMARKGVSLREVFDARALRVVVDDQNRAKMQQAIEVVSPPPRQPVTCEWALFFSPVLFTETAGCVRRISLPTGKSSLSPVDGQAGIHRAVPH
jgi:hypothetical protein